MDKKQWDEFRNYGLTHLWFTELDELIANIINGWVVGNFKTEKESDYHRGMIAGLKKAMEADYEE